MLRSELKIAIRFTLLTTLLLGILYPLAVTGIGQLAFRRQADGELIVSNGQVTGSALIGPVISIFMDVPRQPATVMTRPRQALRILPPQARSSSPALTAI